MTPILFLLGYCIGIVLTFTRHPIFGLYTYLFTFYMAPSHNWWRNDIPELRYLFIAGIATVLATLKLPQARDRAKWYSTPPGRLLTIFVIYNWLQLLWAVNFDYQLEGAFLYTKHLVAFYLMYRLADSVERLQEIALIHVVGCAWFGYLALGASGGRLETIGGAVHGANELGVHVSTGLIFGGLLLLSLRGTRRWLAFACLPLVANCLVLTVSRGAFLGFFAAGLTGIFVIPRRLRKPYAICGVLALILMSLLAHDELVERFTATFTALSSEEQELDNSAVSRFEIAQAGIKIGLEHPLGAGNRATELLSAPYITTYETGRSAHNTSAGVFAEHGFPGLILYAFMVLWVLRVVWQVPRWNRGASGDVMGVSVLAAMAGLSALAIYVSGNFSSNLDLETQYWCLALLAAATELRKSVPLRAPLRSDAQLTTPGSVGHKAQAKPATPHGIP